MKLFLILAWVFLFGALAFAQPSDGRSSTPDCLTIVRADLAVNGESPLPENTWIKVCRENNLVTLRLNFFEKKLENISIVINLEKVSSQKLSFKKAFIEQGEVSVTPLSESLQAGLTKEVEVLEASDLFTTGKQIALALFATGTDFRAAAEAALPKSQ